MRIASDFGSTWEQSRRTSGQRYSKASVCNRCLFNVSCILSLPLNVNIYFSTMYDCLSMQGARAAMGVPLPVAMLLFLPFCNYSVFVFFNDWGICPFVRLHEPPYQDGFRVYHYAARSTRGRRKYQRRFLQLVRSASLNRPLVMEYS